MPSPRSHLTALCAHVVLLAAALVLPAGACPTRALAQSADATRADAPAKRIFEMGREAYVEGRYREAVDAFERVFLMTGHPVMLVNVGNAWARLGETERAIAAFRQYLGLVPDAPERPDLERRIAEMRQSIDAAAVTAAMESEPKTAAAADAKGLFLGRTWTWVAGAGAVVALGAATIAWTGAKSSYDSLSRTCGQTPEGCSASAVGDVSGGVTLTNVALGLAALGFGSATALWFLEAGDEAHGDVETGVSGAVVISPAQLGAVLNGRF